MCVTAAWDYLYILYDMSAQNKKHNLIFIR